MTRTHVTALAAGFTLLALPGLAQFSEGFSVWDSNDDGSINQSEFTETFAELDLFEEWDTDNDGFLSRDEMSVGLYEGYDKDDSGRLERPEFENMLEDFGQDGLLEL